jgi:hypothetical protein
MAIDLQCTRRSSALNRSQTIDARRAAAASSWTRRALGHAFEGDPTCLDQVRATRGTDCRPAERHGEVIFQSLDHATARPHGRQPASPISRPLRRALPGTALGTDVEPVAKSSVRCHIPDSGLVLPVWHLVPNASFTANVTAGQTTTPQPLRGAAADAGSRQCGRIESHVVDRRVPGGIRYLACGIPRSRAHARGSSEIAQAWDDRRGGSKTLWLPERGQVQDPRTAGDRTDSVADPSTRGVQVRRTAGGSVLPPVSYDWAFEICAGRTNLKAACPLLKGSRVGLAPRARWLR